MVSIFPVLSQKDGAKSIRSEFLLIIHCWPWTSYFIFLGLILSPGVLNDVSKITHALRWMLRSMDVVEWTNFSWEVGAKRSPAHPLVLTLPVIQSLPTEQWGAWSRNCLSILGKMKCNCMSILGTTPAEHHTICWNEFWRYYTKYYVLYCDNLAMYVLILDWTKAWI